MSTRRTRDRFSELLDEDPEAAEEFRAALRDYVRKYGFLAQVVGFSDRSLERLYIYGKMLAHVLRKRRDAAVDLGQVDLTHLRIGKTGDHDLGLSPEGEGMLPGFTGGGPGARHEPPRTSLAEIIADLNERFGSNLGQDDLVSGAVKDAMAVPQVQRAALANEDEENFGHVFDDVFEDKLYERIENDTKAMQQYADDPDFNAEIKSRARRYAYESLRRDVA